MPSPPGLQPGEQYSSTTGLIYVFNLIVGTGCLTLPAAFAATGWALSAGGILLLAIVSYMTATWVVESMACANAINHWRRMKQLKKVPFGSSPEHSIHYQNQLHLQHISPPPSPPSTLTKSSLSTTATNMSASSTFTATTNTSPIPQDGANDSLTTMTSVVRGQVADELVNRTLENAEADQRLTDTSEDQDEHDEEVPLITDGVIERTVGEYYAIQEQIEMGQMAKLFYSKVWVKVFYVVLCIYLYGDLAIYEAAVAKSLRDIICDYVPENCTKELLDSDPCFMDSNKSHMKRIDMYRLCTCTFIGCMGPFVFFNLTKTKYMQILTTITRWIAMGTMISWAIVKIADGNNQGHPKAADVTKLPQLFGVCVYSFMCHHSLPALITPISEKRSILKLLGADYLLILLFYLLLAFTGIFAFAYLDDLYTLNFQPDRCKDVHTPIYVYCLQVFLLMFPVFTLSTNFPIIAITLRNNLKGLFLRETRRYSFFTSRLLFPLLAIIPPTIIGLITSSVDFLVGITGAYAGSIIQYVVPATLVYYARKMTLEHIGMGVKNPFSSPLQHFWWLAIICGWAAVCQVFVTLYLFEKGTT